MAEMLARIHRRISNMIMSIFDITSYALLVDISFRLPTITMLMPLFTLFFSPKLRFSTHAHVIFTTHVTLFFRFSHADVYAADALFSLRLLLMFSFLLLF